jgi:16S rRNA (adenine1518-N6/adenine1519-N6)-dimethyltransferase
VTGRGDLQPGSFYPVPDVVSSIVEMTPAPGAPEGEVLKVFSGLARVFFSSRRKTIRNNVKDGAVLGALAEEGIDLGLRAEQIAPEVFVRLARRLTGSSSP